MTSIKSLLLAISLTIFIYLEYFGISLKIIDTFFVLSAFLIIFQLKKKELFFSGFLTGVFWFWWIGYSFIYYELPYLIPVVVAIFGLYHGLLFYIIGLFKNIYLKLSYIFLISFIEPFGFNWFKIELPLINSYLGTSKIEFLILLITSAIFIKYKKKFTLKATSFYFISIFSLFIFNNYINKQEVIKPANLKIQKEQTDIPQDIKWDKRYRAEIIEQTFESIDNAIKNKYDLIIFPETALPFILNYSSTITAELLNKSNNISIIIGSLYQKDSQLYNSTYLFQDNKMQVANKVVLVPFGEAVPFPKFITDWINDTFYDGAQDYVTAKEPTTFDIKGYKFRNAICYEATTDDVYRNLDTPYVIAISNNAWFTPSHQPTLQKQLMRYYSNKYNLYFYNVTNQE